MNDPKVLAETLRSGSDEQRLNAAEELARLGENAQPAAVPLVQSLENEALRDWAVAALEELGPPATNDVAPLAGLVTREGQLDSAYWAATLLGRLGEQAAPAVPALTSALSEHPDLVVRERAAWALSKIGPAAASAASALQEASERGEPRLARLAKEALAQIRR